MLTKVKEAVSEALHGDAPVSNGPLKILWCSDQHCLHNKTPTEHILANLSRFFYVDNDLAKVDMIVFGGDFLDRLVEATDKNLMKVLGWIKVFLKKCEDHNVKVRFLEGTSSHDWGQPKHFEFAVPHEADVKYVDTLSVETFPEFNNLTMMYVPDNMGNRTPDEIWELALQVLNQAELKEVDLIAFHGGFYYQLPEKAWKHAHMESRWESIVKYGIFAGHIHIPSHKGKIYCSGSFDRIRHGEEHPKGGYIIELDNVADTFKATFYENKKALPYLTMWINKEMTAEDLVEKIHLFIRNHKLPPHSQIKIRNGNGAVVNPVVNILSTEYPKLGFSVENDSEDEAVIDKTLFDPNLYQGVTLDENNLFDALYAETQEKFNSLSLSREEVESVLKEFM
ncbi:putative nuclease SbcCD, D subunit [Erwinia phage vB_EamM_RisingSun]|uniref:Putative nuclease SbcCD, D subunit n=2 Tax=Risingsunvirus risingsun TaxID=2560435 RepID=A0A223LHD2_9CAUD|nr:SbcD-like subunit of palindrome specific endonuclease [Erwinia phage vB_EamM_RisingSun]ASU03634.1 putative nuclease SbcCD, D subunit [Erwinia phage vB_EamM_RisingSun]ASU03879.1 putative nuclease SbcCD, D subunit [Erwinia phage vB_EamM_Joad]